MGLVESAIEMSVLYFGNMLHLFRHAVCKPFFISARKFPEIHFPRGKLLFQIEREFLPKRSLEIIKVVHNEGFIEDLFMQLLTVEVCLQRCLQGDIEITETAFNQGLHLVLQDFPKLEITI